MRVALVADHRAATIEGMVHAPNMNFLRNTVLNSHAPSQAPFSYKDSPQSGSAWAGKFRVMRISGFCTHVECNPKTPFETPLFEKKISCFAPKS